ncbi:MAG: Ig-like domain repeat protein [Terracidiphilus sp.]
MQRAAKRLLLLAGLFIATGSLLCATATAQSVVFSGAESTVPVAGTLQPHPVGMAVDAAGNVYVADFANNQVVRESPAGGVYTQTVVVSGLGSPRGIAVDSAGNVYVADYGGRQVYQVPVAGAGYGAPVPLLPASTYWPVGVAVDPTGNVYFTNWTLDPNVRELQWTGSGFSAPVTLPITGMVQPYGITTDALGNLFVADYSGYSVVELPWTGSGWGTQSTLPFTGLSGPVGVTVDSSENVYVADTNNNRIAELEWSGGSWGSQTAVFSSTLSQPQSAAVDLNGNVFIADFGNYRVLEESPQGGNFGSIEAGSTSAGSTIHNHRALPSKAKPSATAVGLSSAGVRLFFGFTGPATVGGVQVLTQGTPGLDFSNAGTGTCAATSYTAGMSCYVDVAFTPQFTGPRDGAVVLVDGSGNPLATGFVFGNGLGPQVNFEIYVPTLTPIPDLPSAESAIGIGISYPLGVAADGQGNVYISDSTNARVLKETFSGGNYTQTVVADNAHNGINDSGGLAVDGAGNVYIADSSAGVVDKMTPGPGGYTQTHVDASQTQQPWAVAVDGYGNVYIADAGRNLVFKETPTPTGYVRRAIGSGFHQPMGIAVDPSGNVFVDDTGNNRIVEETPVAGGYAQSVLPFPPSGGGIGPSGLPGPRGLAADGRGALYIADTTDNSIVKAWNPGSGWVTSQVPTGSALYAPAGVAVDSAGNVYIADAFHTRVVKEDFADPPSLSFADTPWGSKSSDSPQYVVVENIGSDPLNLPAPASGTNPSISTNFTFDPSVAGACPVVAAGASSPGQVPAGGFCMLSISFAPLSVGQKSGALTLTDNNLNAAAPGWTSQSIRLSGRALRQNPVISWPAPAPINFGTPLTKTQLDATANVPGSFTYTPGLKTTLGAGMHTLSVLFTPNDIVNYAPVTATVQITVLAAPVTMSVSCWNPWFNYGADYQCLVYLSSNRGAPTGNITYQFDGGTAVSVPLNSGEAHFVLNKPPVGSHTVYIAYPAQANYGAAAGQTESFTVALAPVNVLLTPSSWTVKAGSPLTLTAAVSSWSAGPPNATGTVAFYDGGVLVATVPVNAGGQASWTSSTLAVGTHNFSAIYSGGANYATGTGYASVKVYQAGQTITFVGLPPTATYTAGLSYPLVATASSGLPVSFSVTGPASISGSTLLISAAGTVTVTASQAGNSNFRAATPVTQTIVVSKAATTLSLTAATNSPSVGVPDLLTATVSGPGGPTGLVVFSTGTTTLCTVPLSPGGVATCSFTPATSGGVTVKAVYTGDAGNAGSFAKLSLNVTGAYDAQVTLHVDSASLNYPQSTNTKTCVASTSKKTVATGTVSIYDGANWLQTLTLGGDGCAYWYIAPALAAGTHPLTAQYFGDKNNPPGTSTVVTVTVAPVQVNLSISCWNGSFPYGGNYSCTVSANSNAGPAPGNLTYSLDGGGPVSLPLNAGNAQFSIVKPAAGNHQLAIAYPAQGSYSAAGPQTEWFTVTPAHVTLQMWASVSTAKQGTGVSFTAQANSGSAGAPTVGTVAFYDNGTLLATVPVNGVGQAITWTSSLGLGTHSITAVYNGNPNFGTATAYTSVTITK